MRAAILGMASLHCCSSGRRCGCCTWDVATDGNQQLCCYGIFASSGSCNCKQPQRGDERGARAQSSRKKFRCKGRQPHAALGACMHFRPAARKGGVGVKQRKVGKGRPELKRAGKGNTEPRSLQRSPKTLTHQEREAGGAGDQSNKERNTAARAPPGELVNTRKGKIVTGKRNADQERRESTAQSGTARERTAQSERHIAILLPRLARFVTGAEVSSKRGANTHATRVHSKTETEMRGPPGDQRHRRRR
jgi:hypothetical protein